MFQKNCLGHIETSMICNFYCGDYKYLYDAVDSEQTKPNIQNKTSQTKLPNQIFQTKPTY